MPASSSPTLSSRANLVHELTHALQDQLGQLEWPDGSEAKVGLRALIEGEAEHVEAAWTESLSDDEREQVEEAEQADTSDDALADLETVNRALVAFFVLPYTVGEAMVEVLDDAGRLESAFEDPPNSSADLLRSHPVARAGEDARSRGATARRWRGATGRG